MPKRTKPQKRLYERKYYRKNKDRLLAKCKRWRDANPEKAKNAIYKSRYDITLADYEIMFETQDGKCAICGMINADGRNLGVDHDHETGDVRGLLCSKCNSALGLINDDINILAKMISYLNK